MMQITQSEVRRSLLLHRDVAYADIHYQPPQLEGEWSIEMKDFIKKMCVSFPVLSTPRSHSCDIRLTFSATERPTPEDMLVHPWLITIMNGPKVPMAAWIRQVWDWPEPQKKK
jgi:mitogen-activated protein kinase kinase